MAATAINFTGTRMPGASMADTVIIGPVHWNGLQWRDGNALRLRASRAIFDANEKADCKGTIAPDSDVPMNSAGAQILRTSGIDLRQEKVAPPNRTASRLFPKGGPLTAQQVEKIVQALKTRDRASASLERDLAAAVGLNNNLLIEHPALAEQVNRLQLVDLQKGTMKVVTRADEVVKRQPAKNAKTVASAAKPRRPDLGGLTGHA